VPGIAQSVNRSVFFVFRFDTFHRKGWKMGPGARFDPNLPKKGSRTHFPVEVTQVSAKAENTTWDVVCDEPV